MKPGEVVVDRVSQRFVISDRPHRTLKDTIVRRDRAEPTVIWALRNVSFSVEPGESVGLVGRNGSAKTTLLRLISGLFRPTLGTVSTGGRIGSLLELGAGFHPEFTGRENVFLNGSIHGLDRDHIREIMDEIVAFAELEHAIDNPVRTYSSGMYMRLGFAVAAHIQADMLLLDEVFAVGDELFQRKCMRKIHEFKNGGGTIIFVSHAAEAVERLCERAVLLREGELIYDGETHHALAEYHRMLAGERNPAELAAGLHEWGSGEARVVDARMLDSDGEARIQFAAGESVDLELAIEAEANLAPPVVTLEVRDEHGMVLATVSQATAELGWPAQAGERTLRFTVERLPFAKGRFHLRCAMADPATGQLLQVRDVIEFHVFPQGAQAGPVLFDGTWNILQGALAAPRSIG